ncbi:Fur family transcriptional regulator [Butyricicoccus sp. Marseille-Q5471]|uniref:Fur family transcriptional regulator n=1 Tax=Butyricicoccus sp. Marseille-Q5471 TaxID=3039493 RepID=UPI0024BC81F5|nr:transcriptional repressor [Butyricicoccus sp. Marseille-Q5471]
MQTRNTVQRQIVLDTVLSMHDHPTADAVYESVSSAHPSISKATVYRNLNQLASQGVIQRVPVANSADRFDFNIQPHYHVRCTCCGAVQDVTMPYLTNLIDQVEDACGIAVERYEILFEGVCSTCRAKQHTT